MAKEQYAQVGQTALRDPITGGYLPAIPLYVRVEDISGAARGAMTVEETAVRDVGKLFAQKMKRYIEGGGVIETERREVKK